MEELKTLKRAETYQAKITRILNFINTQEAHLMRDDCFLNNNYMMEKCRENVTKHCQPV